MKAKHLIVIAAVMIMVAGALKVYAGNLTMTTYYPAPTGFYDRLTANHIVVPQGGTLQISCYNAGHVGLPNEIWVEDPSCPL